MISILTVKELLQLGAILSIDATSYSHMNLKEFVTLAKGKNKQITIKNAHTLSALTLKDLIRIGANLTLEV